MSLDLLRARPDVAQEDVLAVGARADRLGLPVDVHAAGERVGDDERRRGEVVRLHLGMDARLEVAVAREHRADDEVALGDRRRDLVGERARVADARRAAVADGVEAERVEVLLQAGLLVVARDDLRAGRERRLDPRLALQPALDRVLREQPGGDHHLRVRRVRARGDRGDHDGAVVELVVGARDGRALVPGRRPRWRPARCRAPAPARRRAAARSSGRRPGRCRRPPCRASRSRSRRRTCRASRGTPPSRARAARGPAAGAGRRATARRRRGRARRPREYVACSLGSCQSMFSLQYASTSAMRSASGPSGAGSRASPRRRGRSRTSRRTRATCSRSSRGRRAAATSSPRRSTRRTCRRRPVLRRISVTVRTRSVAVAPVGQRAAQLEADDLRHEHRERLPEHRRLGLDPADAPAEHAEAVDHRRVRVGADERVGERDAVAVLDDAREVLEVHLVADAGARRHDLEAAERLLAPAQEEVALAVALELELDVAPERHARRERVDLHRVVDHELGRDQRVDLRRARRRGRPSRCASRRGRRPRARRSGPAAGRATARTRSPATARPSRPSARPPRRRPRRRCEARSRAARAACREGARRRSPPAARRAGGSRSERSPTLSWRARPCLDSTRS